MIKGARQRRRRRRHIFVAGIVIIVATVVIGAVVLVGQVRSVRRQATANDKLRGQPITPAVGNGLVPARPGPLAVGRNGDLYIAHDSRDQILAPVQESSS